MVIEWVKETTRNMLAGIAGEYPCFGRRTRWLLLLFPPSTIDKFNALINRVGSA
jgi:hypothetical protein